MSAESLISKLEALKPNGKGWDEADWSRHHAITEAIAIIRQYEAEQSPDRVERVANAIKVADTHAINHGNRKNKTRYLAKAAIAAMGEIPYRDMFFTMQKRKEELEIEVINLKRVREMSDTVIERGTAEHLIKREIPDILMRIAEGIAIEEDGTEMLIEVKFYNEIEFALTRAMQQLDAFMTAAKRESGDLKHVFEVNDGQNPFRPRIIDLCYTAFLLAKEPNKEDGGPSDWMTDTQPTMRDLITAMKTLIEGGKS